MSLVATFELDTDVDLAELLEELAVIWPASEGTVDILGLHDPSVRLSTAEPSEEILELVDKVAERSRELLHDLVVELAPMVGEEPFEIPDEPPPPRGTSPDTTRAYTAPSPGTASRTRSPGSSRPRGSSSIEHRATSTTTGTPRPWSSPTRACP